MAKIKQFDLWLVRAGSTAWDEEGRLTGAADLPPSSAGLARVRSASQLLVNQKVTAILSAKTEASLLSAALLESACGVRPKAIAGLEEPSLGCWEGVLAAELEDRCRTAYRQWRQDPFSVVAPNGESFEEAYGRITHTISKVLARYSRNGESIVLVVGPIVSGLVQAALRQLPPGKFWDSLEDAAAAERIGLESGTIARLLDGDAVVRG